MTIVFSVGISYVLISDYCHQELSDNTFNETIIVTGKTISIENTYIIDCDKGSFKTQWEDYSTLVVGKKYDVAIYRGTIRTVFGENQGQLPTPKGVGLPFHLSST